jgi:minor curlin subunit
MNNASSIQMKAMFGRRVLAALASTLLLCAALPAFSGDLAQVSELGRSDLEPVNSLDRTRPTLRLADAIPQLSGSSTIATVTQNGTGNSAAIDQQGAQQYAYIAQTGNGNAAAVLQNAAGTRASIEQNGNNNRADVQQSAQGSSVVVRQYGDGNTARVVQH